jgi:hypothetical protein
MLVYVKCFKIVERLKTNENMMTWDNGWTHGLKLAQLLWEYTNEETWANGTIVELGKLTKNW